MDKALKARIAKAPQSPGVYRWFDQKENILYIGKAKNLRNRLKTYAAKKDKSLGPWKQALLTHITDVDWTVTDNELEALILETNLIKEHRPKYNVLMKDDKNYVYIKITVSDPYPIVTVVRRMEERSSLYFGPFTRTKDVRRTLDLLHTVFQFRACTRAIKALNRNPATENKACVESQISKCNGLCTGAISREEYCERIDEVVHFLRGRTDHVTKRLQEMMKEAAGQRKFEKAANLRDTLEYIASLKDRQVVSGTSGANTDIFGIALQSDRTHVVALQERNGKIINELSFSLKGKADTASDALSQFLPQYYAETPDIPDCILCAESFEEQDVLETWLTEEKGKKVTLSVPMRGKKAKLLVMAQENAEEKVRQQLATWEAAAQKIEQALENLKKVLQLEKIPKRIECYDISHLSGTETVGSMVVAMNGKMKNDHYRSFTIRTLKKGEVDDYKALKEVLTRRLRHLQDREKNAWKEEEIALEKNEKAYIIVDVQQEGAYAERGFRYVRSVPKELRKKVQEGEIVMMYDKKKHKPDASLKSIPDLLVIDGGKGQLKVGSDVLKALSFNIPVISLAKREEEVFVPKVKNAVTLDTEALFLLMRLRDEAHRFANNHRECRLTHALIASQIE